MRWALGLWALFVGLTLAAVVPGSGSSEPAAKAKPLCGGKRAGILGTPRRDALAGTGRADVMAGLAASDYLDGRGGDDRICGGAGDDVLTGGAGRDVVDGGPGFDVCRSAEQRRGCEETRPAPAKGQQPVGGYYVDVFEPRFSYALTVAGWSLNYPPALRELVIGTRFDPGGTTIAFDSASAAESVEQTIARLSSIAGTTAAAPSAATVGGRAARSVDVRVTATEIVLVPGFDDRYELEPGDRALFTAVEVGGKTVTVVLEAPAAVFDAFAERATPVLASIRFSTP